MYCDFIETQNAKENPMSNTITTVELAARYNKTPKTMRAIVRRHIAFFEPLFVDGERHVFPNNKTTLKKLDDMFNHDEPVAA